MQGPDFLSRSVRYSFFVICALAALISLVVLLATGHGLFWFLPLAALTGLGIYDIYQPRHAILRNYPILGHMRFFFEYIRPEIRQYFVEGDLEAEPFSRFQRSVVYQRAKGVPDVRP